ncbi:FusB/FusC family EF-G-binding protein [Planococcus sp. ISL-110]|uniref:FusB/FusC family EF-G-binding protein n=1 Tax=Planococcus sp. ISL-110 TaxID=2819167 RepID=UPI001BE9EBB3|nr:FusB/FusC family EF-G-binding protein [Planococcus sp. ISL-110]MBT2571094.1 FusB/FusC family EF-G-binding protein [Planococcus sp. ISL-110]
MIHVKETDQNSGSAAENPKAFIRNDQYNFIKDQTKILVAGQASTNDMEVLNVLRHLAHEKVYKLFPTLTEEQKKLLNPLVQVKELGDAEAFLGQLQPYIIPFKAVTDQGLKKLFPKAKKMKGPKLENINFNRTSYLAWTESSSLMYLVADENNRLIGVQGSFTRSEKQGICTICNRHSKVGMFIAKTKSSGQDQFIKRGNYICQDSAACNDNVNTLNRLNEFIGQFQK